MRTWRSIIALAAAVWLTFGGTARATDCVALARALAPNGAFAIHLADGKSRNYSSSKEWYCSQEFLQYSDDSKANGGINVPTDGTSAIGSFDKSDNNQMQQRTSFCSDGSKSFSNAEDTFILSKYGDVGILDAVKACVESNGTAMPTLHVESPSTHTDTFKVLVSTHVNMHDAALYIGTDIVSNAEPVAAIIPGTKIPAEGSGDVPIIGVFKFHDPQNDTAQVLVRTTIGDSLLDVVRCKAGNAGTWTLKEDVTHETKADAGPFSKNFSISQASCHPKCPRDKGDDHKLDFPAPAGIVFDSPSIRQIGGPVGFNPQSVSLDNNVLHVYVRSRTAGTTYTVTAHQTRVITARTSDPIASGNITFDIPFSVEVDGNTHGQVGFATPIGSAILPESSVQARDLPDWIRLSGNPAVNGSKTIYSFVVGTRECVTPQQASAN